jgi:hypothetical protein
MSIRDICNNLRGYIDELEMSVSGCTSDADCQAALERHIQSHYSSLSSLCWWLGANGKVFQDEAVPASQLAGEAYAAINREREFDLPSYTPQRSHGTYNAMQQFGSTVEGARL